MARKSEAREDLIATATALVWRIELLVAGNATPLVVGFRRDGATSFYFGDDTVYQFNAAGELRRAFVGGLLFKAVNGALVSLAPVRSDKETELRARDLGHAEQQTLIEDATARLSALRDALAAGTFAVSRQSPDGAAIVERVATWLAEQAGIIRVAAQPGLR